MPVLAIDRPGAALRPVTQHDQPFLLSLYASTREAELRLTDWTDAQKQQFVRMQFDAQQRAYFGYPDAEFFLILQDGVPAGRIYLQHRQDAILVIDVSLLPAFCGRGIGSEVLAAVFRLAAQAGKRVQIHVERFNPAQRLYQRLGFRLVEDKGVYLFLEWGDVTV
ncbi:GNAT family N-acetyltransferase [Ralstonia solanacearum]|uniref:GNAT family N-acetyltransferase n=1 Tax=Ralstonia solanacearum TaxID=305 RepID=A0AAE3T4J9_RALSL|nr:GNAT family N-acetyltransferase [Ralstonia solanacearum]MBB6580225.1 GNAT family N-acetyltransferase [Ralstonia solanacearum]MDB0523211.1 GNAT family N-acetyltransferase [Ralstonia solanacearum]QHB53729.1 GNAT family N-acetyltransferase [Ralstonia solanacearum]